MLRNISSSPLQSSGQVRNWPGEEGKIADQPASEWISIILSLERVG